MVVKCSAATCIFYLNGICGAKEIELIDFEYYQDISGKEKDISSDDMKCSSYKSIYEMEE